MLIRVASHRARHTMARVIGRMPCGYFSYHFPGEFRQITAEEWQKLNAVGWMGRRVKGLTRARVDRAKLHPYLY